MSERGAFAAFTARAVAHGALGFEEVTAFFEVNAVFGNSQSRNGWSGGKFEMILRDQGDCGQGSNCDQERAPE